MISAAQIGPSQEQDCSPERRPATGKSVKARLEHELFLAFYSSSLCRAQAIRNAALDRGLTAYRAASARLPQPLHCSGSIAHVTGGLIVCRAAGDSPCQGQAPSTAQRQPQSCQSGVKVAGAACQHDRPHQPSEAASQ